MAGTGTVEWAIWANENAISSSFVLLLGGILAVSGQLRLWEIGVYAIIVGLVLILLEYPRSRRKKGTSHERMFQYPIAVIVSKGGLLTRNYFVRFVAYLLFSIPCYFTLPTILGGVCYAITSFIYLTAGIKGEEWLPILPNREEEGPTVIEEPRRPPPRRPDDEVLHVGAGRNRL